MADIPAFSGVSATAMVPFTAQTDKLLHQASTAAGDNQKIDKSAKDFESILLGSWLQQAEHSFAEVPGEDDDPDSDSGKDQYLSIAMESLGNAMSASGGVGIAKMIASHLHKAEGHRSSGVAGTEAPVKK